jgi:trans-AT polyketide synthase/acyltransferase/oxidoreductase domain-containing protein
LLKRCLGKVSIFYKLDKDETEENSKITMKQVTEGSKTFEITADLLGNNGFKADYNLKYAYVTGGMYRGIASKEMVVKMGKSGMMGFFGTGGLDLSQIEEAIRYIQKELAQGEAYGMNLIHNLTNPDMEEKMVDLFLKYQVRKIEAAAFLDVTSALVKYHTQSLTRDKSGYVSVVNRIIAKVSRPEVAKVFLKPAPEPILMKLVAENKISREEAVLAREIPLADDICVEADSGGHTDGGVAYVLVPTMLKIRDEMAEKFHYHQQVRVGTAGGIGTPEAAAAAFILGADFIMTGSINQCTLEAATSDAVKDLLQQINVQDTEYAPAGDMFELGAKVQVLKKGLLFPARANKLYGLYCRYNSLDEIDEKTQKELEERYFKRSFEEVYQAIKLFYPAAEIKKVDENPRHKMALIFRWYFGYASRLALSGSKEAKVDYQVHCGPALGAFNQWVKGTPLENWRKRHVDVIGEKIMIATATLLNDRLHSLAYMLN